MVGKIICGYMSAGNKKLTVPGFGTFMRKDDGDIIFVDLLRKDDGVLRELVENYGHYSAVEAMALVDRFIFETKNGIERDGGAAIEGFGTMYLDDKGLYQFNPVSVPDTRQDHSAKNPAVTKTTGQKKEPRMVGKADDREAEDTPAVRQPPRTAPQKPNRSPRKKPQSKPDWLIIVAIVAAVIALSIMVFGLSSGHLPFL